MPWFAAHAVLYFQHTDGPQDRFCIYENVLLIEAADSEQAFSKAETRARVDEGDCDGTLTLNGRPARQVFGGIRKLITVCHENAVDQLGAGDEITYSQFEVADRDALQRFIRGDETAVLYLE